MKIQPSYRKVVFLDTMTLHYIRLCLEYAQCRELRMPVDEQAVSELKGHFCNVREEPLRESLSRGLQTIVRLASRDVQIEYAAISELEMLRGVGEGTFRLKVAQEGIPHRMWSRFSQKAVRDRITIEELRKIKGRIDALASMIEDSGIFVVQSGSKRTSEVFELAKAVAGLIFMSEIDSVIYASALASEADFLVTADSYFRQTVNEIRDSKERSFQDIRERLFELIGDMLLEENCEFELPRAFTVMPSGKLKGVTSFP